MQDKIYIKRIASMYRRNASAVSASAIKILKGLDTGLSHYVSYLLKFKRHKDLLDLKLNPSDYVDPFDFRDDYLAVELLSKFPYLDVKIDRESVAIAKFEDAELQCSETNIRLSRLVSGSLHSPYTPWSIISMARLKIAKLLGPFSWDEAELHFGFGPGSTTSLPKIRGDAYFKYGAVTPHTTKACSLLGWTAVKRIPRWFDALVDHTGIDRTLFDTLPALQQAELMFKIVPGNRVTTVPKNAKTDRVIAIEPDLNMFIQKGIGGILRSRLKRVGIDLDDQTRNQSMAKEGSLTNLLSTIDLSSASDTVSMRLVEEVLPSDWLQAIKLARSPKGILPSGKEILYHKVSSMGNGFTFELESLIFWAICSSVITLLKPDDSRLVVYGDDIIVSSSVVHTIIWMLSFVGFTVNIKKTFSDGPFRESCGKHFFKGVDVTPFYIRDDVKTPERLIWLANQIRRWARHPIWGLDGRLFQPYTFVVNTLPECLRKPSIPDGFGDLALIGDFDECRPKWSKRWQCLVGIGYGDIRRRYNPGEVSYLLRQLGNMERLAIKPFLSEISGVSSSGVCNSRRVNWKVVKLPVTRWENYGSWLLT